jgi:hypothetical protein
MIPRDACPDTWTEPHGSRLLKCKFRIVAFEICECLRDGLESAQSSGLLSSWYPAAGEDLPVSATGTDTICVAPSLALMICDQNCPLGGIIQHELAVR